MAARKEEGVRGMKESEKVELGENQDLLMSEAWRVEPRGMAVEDEEETVKRKWR